MKHLLEHKCECTDPNYLQFCVKINEKCWWYCQPATFTKELEKYLGYPQRLLDEGRHLILTEELWAHGEISLEDIDQEEIDRLCYFYGRNNSIVSVQIIIEMYFETYIHDFVSF